MSDDPEQERRDQQASERERSARNRSSVDLLKLAGSASSAASSLLQLPDSITSVTSSLSKNAGQVVNFFESQVQLLRGFGEFGVTFNNDVGKFTADVARSRVSYQQLAGIVQNQTQALMMFGPSAQQGLNSFLRVQADFRDGMRMQVDDLKQLGYTTSEINETFLEFDRIQNMARIRTYSSDRERNLAAVEFAENLDKLTSLTGKRREQLAQEMAEVSRSGDVQARSTQLGERGARSLQDTVTVMGGFGEGIQNLTRDILTRGYALDASMAGIAGPLTDSLYALRQAQETGNQELIAQKEAEVRHAAAALRTDRRIIELAIHKGRNEYGDLAAGIMEDSAEGMARAIEHARNTIAERTGKSTAEVTSEELRRYLDDMYDQSTAARLNRATEGPDAATGGQQLFTGVQQTLTQLEDIQAQAVETAAARIFGAAGDHVASFGRYLDGIITNNTVGGAVDSIVGLFDDAIAALTPGGVDSGAQNAANNAFASGNAELARQIQTLRTQLENESDPNRAALLQEQLNELIRQAPSTLEILGNTSISTDGDIIATANSVDLSALAEAFRQREADQSGAAGTNNSIGSLGTIGRYFKDYGLGTNVTLHGMETVMTPRQAAEFGASIAGGAASELVNAISESSTSGNRAVVGSFDTAFNSSMQNMTGKLNTIRNNAERALTNNETIDLEELERRITSAFASVNKTDIGKEIKDAFAPVSELVSISREQLNVGQRQLKGIRGMSGDVLRGA